MINQKELIDKIKKSIPLKRMIPVNLESQVDDYITQCADLTRSEVIQKGQLAYDRKIRKTGTKEGAYSHAQWVTLIAIAQDKDQC